MATGTQQDRQREHVVGCDIGLQPSVREEPAPSVHCAACLRAIHGATHGADSPLYTADHCSLLPLSAPAAAAAEFVGRGVSFAHTTNSCDWHQIRLLARNTTHGRSTDTANSSLQPLTPTPSVPLQPWSEVRFLLAASLHWGLLEVDSSVPFSPHSWLCALSSVCSRS